MNANSAYVIKRYWLPCLAALATAVTGIGTANAVAKKAALSERRLHAPSDRAVIKQGSRHKAAESDQAQRLISQNVENVPRVIEPVRVPL